MKHGKTFLTYLLAIIMIVALVPTAAFAETKATSVVASGRTGGLDWSLSSNGTLTISGDGVMPGYSYTRSAPWSLYQSRITSVVIENGVENISTQAFYNCSSIASVTIPDSVTQIWGSAFYGCESLTSVTIPDSVNYLGARAFYGCSSLAHVTFSKNIAYINDYTFYDCAKLSNVVIPDGVTFIGERAFAYCDDLDAITIPKSVTSIAAGAFYHYSSYCSGVTVMYYGSESDWDNITIGANNTKLERAIILCSAPTIKTQPADATMNVGDTAKFTVSATGNDLTYQWQYRANENAKWKNSGAASAKTKTLSVKATADRDGYQYQCIVTGTASMSVKVVLYSDVVTLHVVEPNFSITKQPSNVTIASGATAKFAVTTSGDNLSYQWQYRTSKTGKWKDSGAASATTNTFSVKGTVERDGYQYRCKITGDNGAVLYSNTVTLHVANFSITKQPSSVTVANGVTAKFTVSVSGDGMTYQWQYRANKSAKWKDSGATSAKTNAFSIKGTTDRNGYQYRCKITDSNGVSVYTNTVTLSVANCTITKQPKDVTVSDGATAEFIVTATGDGLTYQWQYRTSATGKWKDSGATSATTNDFSVKGTAARNGYQYRCKITDSNGKSVYTKTVTLTVK